MQKAMEDAQDVFEDLPNEIGEVAEKYPEEINRIIDTLEMT